jgi:DNA-binding CsgD family transcriptional regulator
LIADGQTTRQIAGALGISPKTVELHRGRLMAKLDIHDTAGLVRYALRSGLATL